MRTSYAVLASLAVSALAYPADLSLDSRDLDTRTFPLGISGGLSIGGSVGGSLDLEGIIGGVLGISGHATSSVTILGGISAQAAAALQGSAIGCASVDIHADARAELKAWLQTQAYITGSLKASLISWCDGGAALEVDVLAALSVFVPTCAEIAAKEQLYVTLDGILSISELESTLVLSAAAQAELVLFLKGAVDLSADVKAALWVIAEGGVCASLTAEVKAALVAWVHGAECTLSATLKAAVIGLLDLEAGVDVVAVGALSETALTVVSVGASIAALVEETGALTAAAQASLLAYLKAGVELDVSVRTALEACAAGHLAAGLSIELRTALAIWLSGASCDLGVELKAVVLLWLSLAVSAEASVDLVAGLVGDVLGFLTETLLASLSIEVRGALGLLAAGESITCLTFETIAELVAFLGGCVDIDIGFSFELIIIEWITGCRLPGAPAPSSTATVSIGGSTSVTLPAALFPPPLSLLPFLPSHPVLLPLALPLLPAAAVFHGQLALLEALPVVPLAVQLAALLAALPVALLVVPLVVPVVLPGVLPGVSAVALLPLPVLPLLLPLLLGSPGACTETVTVTKTVCACSE
ncbi:hypothetical protein N7470_005067 [Penicillium chermesinum]|nr:hypothetical protein N7470_005067 [Penicillium chermesinum]